MVAELAPARTMEAIDRPSGEIKLEARDLNVCYGGFHALKQVTMAIPARRVTALIGPSGCGKSTFLRCFNRMNDLVDDVRIEGDVLLDGADIYGREVDAALLRKRVGMVFQQPNPFPMSIYDNIAYGPRLHGVGERSLLDEIVEGSLRSAALWDEVKEKLRQSALGLSGGQQQRLCIARVLAVQPEVLLMDEPASALDPNATFRIEELMLQLMEQYTIVVVTHNMYQASRVSQYTGFFLLGELVEFGVTERIFETPRDKRTDDYIRGRFG
jgi:phosphate transport system ATP-binding protein